MYYYMHTKTCIECCSIRWAWKGRNSWSVHTSTTWWRTFWKMTGFASTKLRWMLKHINIINRFLQSNVHSSTAVWLYFQAVWLNSGSKLLSPYSTSTYRAWEPGRKLQFIGRTFGTGCISSKQDVFSCNLFPRHWVMKRWEFRMVYQSHQVMFLP